MNSGKVLVGLLAGVAAGAILGILLAPDKGSDTVKKITKKREEYADGLTEKFNDFLSKLTDKIEDVKEIVENVKIKSKAVKDEYTL